MQCECIRPGARFAEGVSANGVGRQLGQITLLLLFTGPAQQSVVDQRILNVNHDPGRGVHPGKFFDSQNGLKEGASSAAILLRNLDSHQAELEELLDQTLVKDALLIHFFGQGTHLLVGKLPDVVAE